jgi:hypothetical protein
MKKKQLSIRYLWSPGTGKTYNPSIKALELIGESIEGNITGRKRLYLKRK